MMCSDSEGSDSPTMMCNAEVTGSLVPTVAKQIQSVEPETNKQMKVKRTQHRQAAL